MLLMGRNNPDDPLPTIIMDIDGGGVNCTVDHPFTGITNTKRVPKSLMTERCGLSPVAVKVHYSLKLRELH